MIRSPLHARHSELGARFTEFGGWEMPVQYEGVLAEHHAVRSAAGVFDVTHLGRFELTGGGAHRAVQRLLCNDIDRISPGRCQYTMLLDEHGGIVDDLIVWWWDPERFWVLPNAANHDRVMATFAQEQDVAVDDLQGVTVMLAVQGPEAPRAIESVLGARPARFRAITVDREDTIVHLAGTGYTGEPGAEICLAPRVAPGVLDDLIEAGVTPAGLGARDTLRLEAGLSLWGNDMDETVTPLEAGLESFVAFDTDFVGKAALLERRDSGPGRRRVSFVLTDRGVPRHGHRIRTAGGGEGLVTSGNMSPLLGRGVGLGLVSPPPEPDETMAIEIRDRWVPAVQKQPPFHK